MAKKLHPATRYAIEAIEGKYIIGNTERLACSRHLYDLARAGELPGDISKRLKKKIKAPIPKREKGYPWTFDEEQANLVAIEWFSYLRHIKGREAGQPIKLIPTHVFEISCIFGWVSRSEMITRTNGRKVGVRRFRKALVSEARKNSKTTRGAGIGLYMMTGDMEAEPEVYCTAVDKQQARVLYNSSAAMGDKSPEVRARLKIGKYEITHRTRGGQMIAFSGDVKNKDAFNPSCAFIDEYHAHPTSEIFDLISSAKGQRAQPLMYIISTAGMDIESPFHAEYEYGKMILNGQAENDRYFVMIRELDEGDDEHDPRNWVKANPLLASSKIMLQELQDMHDEAFGSGNVAKIRTFRVKNLNLWVHGNENSYMGDYLVGVNGQPSKWKKCQVSREKFLEVTEGLLCLVGVDLSKRIDLTAAAYIFALEDGRVAISAHGFIPEEAVARHEKTDRIPYREWAKAGWLTITAGDVVDYASIQEQIRLLELQGTDDGDQHILSQELQYAIDQGIHYALDNGWKVHEIAYDPYNATHFKNEQDEAGYTTIEVRQTMPNLNEATKMFRELVASGKLVHDGSPLLTWCVGNAQEIIDSKENVMVSKKKSKDTRRVDLLSASITGLTQIQSLRNATSYDDWHNSDDFGF